MKLKVLFLCAQNSVQSPIAEALLGRADSEHFEVSSAGLDSEPLHPLTLDVMKEIGINMEGRVPTPVRDVLHQKFDLVITMGDRVKNRCPSFGNAEHIHWQFDDPSTTPDLERQKQMFRTL